LSPAPPAVIGTRRRKLLKGAWHNVFEAARRHGVKRIVFASSNHALGFYPRRRRIGIEAPVRPDSR
jgi:nucleoside-diphosphate-sugar epimerase